MPAVSAPCTLPRPATSPASTSWPSPTSTPNAPRAPLKLVDWPEEAFVEDIETALATRATTIITDASALFDAELDVIVEATGNPIVGINHALRAIETGKHIIMVTVEADALAGPALAKRAKEAGVVYSLAYGDQPALIGNSWTGPARRASTSSAPARAPNTSPTTTR